MENKQEHPQEAKTNHVSAAPDGRNGDGSFCGFDPEQKPTPEPEMAESGRFQERQPADALNLLRDLCYQRSRDAGWHDNPRDDGTFIALIHSEVSECLEGLRKDLMDDHLPHRKMAEVELADTLIRIFDFAGHKGYDLGGALLEKLAYNATREDHKREVRALKGGKTF